ncbi:MAG: VWA domain-containing protein [Synechococcaceae cyanobacterium SM2_3_2]|nr:VWA domain-containing protein [Synechococcaceae cyanobacterium SM2_3_2]
MQSPQESVAPPAWIIVLLDMSGSMRAPDPRGGTRLEGAISSIRQFLEATSQRSGDTQVSIVPFGEGSGSLAECAFTVDNNTINNFFFADDVKLENFLDTLGTTIPCASTNIYDPLTRSVRFLSDIEDPRFAPQPIDSGLPDPRLSVILLSDGFDNAGNEEQRFNNLESFLSNNDRVIVHTIAYGERYTLEDRPVTRADVEAGAFDPELFLDEQRLQQIAFASGGLYAYTPDQFAIRDSLLLFLDSLLGEYEITYAQQLFDRGLRYTLTANVSPSDGEIVSSEPSFYRMLGVRRLGLATRINLLIATFAVFLFAGLLPFLFWANYLRNQESES